MLRRLIYQAAGLGMVAFCASTANAVPIEFGITGGSATAYGFAEGTNVSIQTNDELISTFTLDVGSSKTVKFLDISVSGKGIAAGFIDASLQFGSPVVGDASGLLVGLAVILDSLGSGGVTPIDHPGLISFGDGGLFGISFNGFTKSCFACTALSGTVTATISLLKAPTRVPEPGRIMRIRALM